MPEGKTDGERNLGGVHFVSMTVSRQNKKLPSVFFYFRDRSRLVVFAARACVM
jgi:hypothetical protein